MIEKYRPSNLEKESIGLTFIEATGFSMWPFLKPGVKLVIKKADKGDLRIGDIVLYKKDGQCICHRLVKKVKDREGVIFYIRGDNSVTIPEGIHEEMLLGRAIGIVKKGRIVNLEARNQRIINYFIVILAPFVSRLAKFLKPHLINRMETQ